MSTCRIVASLRATHLLPTVAGANHRDRAHAVALEVIAVGARDGPPFEQPRSERLANPWVTPVEMGVAVDERYETGIDDDVVGVVDVDLAGERHRPMNLH